MFGMGLGEWLVLLVIILVLFGPNRLPQLMESIGKSIQSFRKGLREPPEIDVTPKQEEEREGAAGNAAAGPQVPPRSGQT
jgi:sec-independent protein translocase protein TatA